ncbi:hypothetical protein GGH95_001105 [Coemansia sp. RSA 1836]|nr:hypothetical protein GGH95_001105 [Coemansia sp. RSA 1836]
MDASTASVEYACSADSSTAFVLSEHVSGGEAPLSGVLERIQRDLNTKLTAMMAAEKSTTTEPSTPANESNTSDYDIAE